MGHIVKGTSEASFSGLRDLLGTHISKGDEGGYIDESGTRGWDKDTIVNVFSTTKTITSLAALILIDRGPISPYEKVATYWPEFAVNGKQDIEIRHIISHTSGVPGWEQPVTLDDGCNFDKAVPAGLPAALMDSGNCFWLSFFHPWLGVVDSDLHRVSDLIPWAAAPDSDSNIDADSIAARVMSNPKFTPNMANTTMWRQAELGTSNGHGNARSIAKILSTISLGGSVDGKRLLKPATIDLIFQEMSNGIDLVTSMPVRFGVGYGITGEGVVPTWLPNGRICFWSGLGGSVAIMDLDRRMTIVIVMNKLYPVGLGSDLTIEYVKEIYRAVEVSGLE
ncbi:Beta-lactamase domain-containing protein [Fusarium falciforme]|uniref:Beta-lactamase domain-containing protein n=1 Tax=Fusarium falciforme TaxID=195108 RepID=UPI0023009CC9|nr:Beta-lactamase domain-containing protein [Fusarium falciforme]WAO93403.1 Beta-lactamase domain-containing protein [Fusarium falciforme]